MARNRKRAKERRARRPEPVVSARRDREDGAPPPIAHSAPDVELAEAQLAVGRDPELEVDPGAQLDEDDLAQNGDFAGADSLELPGTGAGDRGGDPADPGGPGGSGGAGARAKRRGGAEAAGPAQAAVVEHRPNLVSRLMAFLEGCWHELQRVQWPDRRQVIQATGVVIGFVIVAGVYLGVADRVANELVKFVLK